MTNDDKRGELPPMTLDRALDQLAYGDRGVIDRAALTHFIRCWHQPSGEILAHRATIRRGHRPPLHEPTCAKARCLCGGQPGPDAEGERGEDVRLCVAALVTDPGARVLLVQSSKPGRGWELPGGGVEPGEAPGYAAVREVREETGIEIFELHTVPTEIHGTVKPGAAYRSRIALYRATAEGAPKAGSDALGAGWFTARQVQKLSQYGLLSDLDTRPALLAWAKGAP